MRTMEVRAKKFDDEEWIYGNFLYKNGYSQIVSLSGVHQWDIIRETTGEYTGLLDKNERKIYEGDILQRIAFSERDHEVYEIPITQVVVYKDGCFLAENIKYKCEDESLIWVIKKGSMVIGNIHDNPELNESRH
jgi:uncharacterized phage protein (TIGR01671 family)